MATTDERFQQLLDDARRDSEVIGVVVAGSRGKGFGTLPLRRVLLRLDAYNRDGIDLGVWPLSQFEALAAWGTEHAWARYVFANVDVPVDKTGDIRKLVDAKGFIPDEHRLSVLKDALGAYTNSLYRAVVEPLARAVGCDYEFDEWGDRFPWMKTYRPDET